ncbi:MAG: 2-hydroxyacyl-CoA dehydratase [Deltaproteobacteria bacterium]|nr:2-hydroxyacyl-CoA dehydratase [Deltaproteobacteria bacterium]MBW1929856.1 2-hydroxyacyl-CoA dehydratase [Deltaproteobacteria bacterium]MBW2025746.1 2-hydroxyacyl-CoA dehydratase [Deltaproteobacteria bacterium]MBW2124358.1 2-hydroxyacyl-CoA dehydratase [Deltaproteobacteria bacterium]
MATIGEEEKISHRALKRVVRNPLTYWSLAPLMEIVNLREQSRAYKIWVRYLIWMMRSACSKRKKVIWMSAFTPVELAYAVGAIPILPEIIAALVSYLGWAPPFISIGNSMMSTDVCSFYRCALGLAVEGYLPRPDLIVSSSHLCDGANKFFSYLSQRYACSHLLLDPPYDTGPEAHGYVTDQLRYLLAHMVDLMAVSLSEEELCKVVGLSNTMRKYMVRINRLRMAIPAPFPGSEGLSYLAGMGFCSPGSTWGVRFSAILARELEDRVAKKRGYLDNERYRVLWLHHIRPYYQNDIFQFLSSQGVSVCFEEANYMYWPPFDPTKPLDSLAHKILSNVWAGPLERRLGAVKEMVNNYRVNGVIHFSHWGCRQSCGGASIIGDFLKDQGVPYMILYGDGADPDNYFPGQTRTRLQAFVEMLG